MLETILLAQVAHQLKDQCLLEMTTIKKMIIMQRQREGNLSELLESVKGSRKKLQTKVQCKTLSTKALSSCNHICSQTFNRVCVDRRTNLLRSSQTSQPTKAMKTAAMSQTLKNSNLATSRSTIISLTNRSQVRTRRTRGVIKSLPQIQTRRF